MPPIEKTSRCQQCSTGGNKLMCDVAFASAADALNSVADREIGDSDQIGEVMDFVAFGQKATFDGLVHQLRGPFSFGCQLTNEQITVRLRETQEFRKMEES